MSDEKNKPVMVPLPPPDSELKIELMKSFGVGSKNIVLEKK